MSKLSQTLTPVVTHALCAGLGAFAAVMLLASFGAKISLLPLQTIAVSNVARAGLQAYTVYNPLGISMLCVLALLSFAGGALLISSFAPTLARASGLNGIPGIVSSHSTPSLNSELITVLTNLQAHLAANEGFGQSLVASEKRIVGLSGGDQFRAIIKLLIDETLKSRKNVQSLQSELIVSKKQLNEMKDDLNEAKDAALVDPLTSVGNRRRFDQELARAGRAAVRTQAPLALVMCDVDNFKKINDTYGHLTGDEVLKSVAAVLAQAVRGADVVARYGGEEFGIILPGTDARGAKSLAERMREQLGALKLKVKNGKNAEVGFTASFGIAQLRHGEQLSALVERADISLYSAKKNGKNRVSAIS